MQTINLDKLPLQARLELLDFYEFLLEKYVSSEERQNENKITQRHQPRLGDLAVHLFGEENGIELALPQRPAHEPLDFEQ